MASNKEGYKLKRAPFSSGMETPKDNKCYQRVKPSGVPQA